MLVITRKKEDSFTLRNAQNQVLADIKILGVDEETKAVKIGIAAPPEILILRDDIKTQPKEILRPRCS